MPRVWACFGLRHYHTLSRLGFMQRGGTEKISFVNSMIDQSIYKLAGIAQAYYKIRNPERGYSRARAHRSFIQDKNIDKKILRRVITEAYRKQLKAL